MTFGPGKCTWIDQGQLSPLVVDVDDEILEEAATQQTSHGCAQHLVQIEIVLFQHQHFMRLSGKSLYLDKSVPGNQRIDLPAEVSSHDPHSPVIRDLEQVCILALEQDDMFCTGIKNQLHGEDSKNPDIEQDKVVDELERNRHGLAPFQQVDGTEEYRLSRNRTGTQQDSGQYDDGEVSDDGVLPYDFGNPLHGWRPVRMMAVSLKFKPIFRAPHIRFLMDSPFKKSIGFFALTMIAVGACIGSGIFISPSDVAAQLANGRDVMLVWGIGGVVALSGALTFAEMASRFPGTGGVYVYLREAYGRLVAFLYGWCILTVITSGAIAALCLAFARYAGLVFGFPEERQLWIGLAALVIVTLVNVRGVSWSALLSNYTTLVKVFGIAAIVLTGAAVGRMFGLNLRAELPLNGQGSFGLALIGVLWSYGGWHHASYVGGEVRDAQRVVPRALVAGALIVTLIYMAVNAGYLALMPMAGIAASKAVAAEALMQVTAAGGILVAALIAISTFGTAGIYTLSAPRIYFSMGADKIFFSWLDDIHATYGTPAKAILLQSLWAAVLMVFWGTFENLVTYVVFMDWIFMTLAALGLFYFRIRPHSQPAGGYRVPFYPVIPLIFIGISLWFLTSTLIGRPAQAVAGLVLMGIGVPVFLLFRRKARE